MCGIILLLSVVVTLRLFMPRRVCVDIRECVYVCIYYIPVTTIQLYTTFSRRITHYSVFEEFYMVQKLPYMWTYLLDFSQVLNHSFQKFLKILNKWTNEWLYRHCHINHSGVSLCIRWLLWKSAYSVERVIEWVSCVQLRWQQNTLLKDFLHNRLCYSISV